MQICLLHSFVIDRLDSDNIGRHIDAEGEIIILILNPSSNLRSFSVEWDGLLHSPVASLQSTNYLASRKGDVLIQDAQLRLLTLILNPPIPRPLNLKLKVPGFEDSCANLTFSIFEVTVKGNLKELTRYAYSQNVVRKI
jgi:hypothetical protein